MSERRGTSDNGSGMPASTAGGGLPPDLILLDEVDMVAKFETPLPPPSSSPSAGKNDTFMQTAEAIDLQLQQMTAWKHQLSQQMELLRRDGLKILERQKNLAVEKRRLMQEREALAGERAGAAKLMKDIAAERVTLDEQAAALEKATESLLALQGQREKWLGENSELEKRRAELAGEIAAFEPRAAEYKKLESERETLLRQIHEAKATLDELSAAGREVEAQKRELELRVGEMGRQREEVAEREGRALSQEMVCRDAAEQLELQRRALVEAQAGLARDRGALDAKISEHTAWLETARGDIESEQVGSKQQVAAAEARLRELAGEQEKLDAERQSLANRASGLESQEAQLAVHEHDVRAMQAAAQEQQARLAAQQEELAAHQARLAAAEATLGEQRARMEAELAGRVAAAGAAEGRLAEHESSAEAAGRETQKRLDEREAQIAEELEHVAKQTRRLNERRAQVEEAEKNCEFRVVNSELEARAEALEGRRQELMAEVAGWREKYEAAAAVSTLATGDAEETQRLQAAVLQAQGQLDQADAKNSELEERARALEARRQELMAEVAEALERHEQEVAGLRQAYEERVAQAQEMARAAGAGTGGAEIAGQTEMLEAQRNALGMELEAARDTIKRQGEEAAIAMMAAESDIGELKAMIDELQSEKPRFVAVGAGEVSGVQGPGARTTEADEGVGTTDDDGLKAGLRTRADEGVGTTVGTTKERLLRQARTLRAYRKQTRETKNAQEAGREDIAAQRDQLRQRKENLEQVKRLLEKQEMVMARKLADHNALKTVAAVGIFVIMILGSTFAAAYQFASVTYGSQALLRVTAPPKASGGGPAFDAWLTRQAATIRSPDMTAAAWKLLRSDGDRYSGHGDREEWRASLDRQLAVKVDPGTRSIEVSYESPTKEGAAQVSNALANALVLGQVVNDEPQRGTFEMVKAYPPDSPKRDGRFILWLTTAAGLLLLSLVAVMAARHYIARQLREIDRMADEADLEDLNGEMPVGT